MRTTGSKFLILLAGLWLIITLGLVTWWWIYILFGSQVSGPRILENTQNFRRMFLWEGSFLLVSVLSGGIALIILSYKDNLRHERLRLFFSNFSHDIKTSITRLRLQSEILQEKVTYPDPIFNQLILNISKLDLQLENALQLSQGLQRPYLFENVKLSHLIEHIRTEWLNIEFKIIRDFEIHTDRRALISILRNIVSNAVTHAQCQTVEFKINEKSHSVEIQINTDGKAFQGQLNWLGKKLMVTDNKNSNGIGLCLTAMLVKHLGGNILFNIGQNQTLEVRIQLPLGPIDRSEINSTTASEEEARRPTTVGRTSQRRRQRRSH